MQVEATISLRELHLQIDSIRNETRLCGGVYMYANHQGCDGGRLYYGIPNAAD
jgi:NAD+ synthase (glutamine-hydrolysing)